MNNIRKFHLAFKNAQKAHSKSGPSWLFPRFHQYLELELNKLGFYGSISFRSFIAEFKKLTAKRRQSIMRIGRAALKRNTQVNLEFFTGGEKLRWIGNTFKFTKSEQDLRKIPFWEDIQKKEQKRECEKYIKLLKSMISDEEIIKMVLDGATEGCLLLKSTFLVDGPVK